MKGREKEKGGEKVPCNRNRALFLQPNSFHEVKEKRRAKREKKGRKGRRNLQENIFAAPFLG